MSGVFALLWANTGLGDVYRALLRLRLGPQNLHIWINDGLMALFFLLVGLRSSAR